MMEFKRILVPLDGSSLSERALPVAMSLARKYDGQIILLYALERSGFLMKTITHPQARELADQLNQQAEAEAQYYLMDHQDRLAKQGFDVRFLVGNHAAAEEIINAAVEENVDLIVISTHGRGGLARWAYGSVTEKVARHARCPVLVVRQGVVMAGSEHEELAEKFKVQM
jgi:nucleotide-binding universal stress UspA family protein